jgi:hypothetical protein
MATNANGVKKLAHVALLSDLKSKHYLPKPIQDKVGKIEIFDPLMEQC